MLIAAPFGFYGYGNIGDEASLQGFARLVKMSRRPLRVLVAAQDPRHTAKVEPSFWYHQYQGEIRGFWPKLSAHLALAYVFAGGTPVAEALGDWPLSAWAPMVEHGRSWKKPCICVGIGTERLTRDNLRAILRDRVIPGVTHWSVRSAHDKNRLLELGADPDKVTVAADMAWLLPPADQAFGRRTLDKTLLDGRPLIGVNINAETVVMERAPQLMERLAAGLDALVERHNARIVFLFNEVRDDPTFDKAAAERVRGAMKYPQAAFAGPQAYLSPAQMMSLISCCTMTISTRYHFCLFSALQNVPFLAIKRSDKVSDLCADLGWEFAAAPEGVDKDWLVAQAGTLLEQNAEARSRLAKSAAAMTERSHLNLRAIDSLFDNRLPRLDWVKLVLARALKRA